MIITIHINSHSLNKILLASFLAIPIILSSSPDAYAVVGSFFLTGHDPDFHASLGANAVGARNIITSAVAFTTDPAFNPFSNAGVDKFLFVESKITAPGGHTNGVNGIVASGFVLGTDFEHHDATTLNAELDQLGTKYSAIVVASDFGGVLTSAELDILNARSADIIDFLNSGGGLVAFAESNSQAQLTSGSDLFGFLPFLVTSTQFNQAEVGITVTVFGAGLGLQNSDVNGNASHNIFVNDAGLEIVDTDSDNMILTIAGRGQIRDGEIDPDPDDAKVGGELIPIESTALLLAGVQTFSWMIPVVLSVLGIGLFAVSRKKEC